MKKFSTTYPYKVGPMKNLVKAMNKDGGGFQYLKTKFPRISDAKMKEGIFVGPQIRELMNDSNFESTLNEAEQRAWTAFVEVCHNFLGNKKKENYREIILELLSSYKTLKCNMCLKFISWILIWISFPLILEQYQMNTTKGFIKTYCT
ncbi:hypothetical protein EVAR_85988_1 [Eumeta japonica]|uniref:Uncharacterized protein n=1 Tax=Eumeta variegata TaxID=151549 RepID=A0A4C1UKI5_EUMVA|nr:hypothetical protein EVAR_85988_1 [Eumeta japonica]